MAATELLRRWLLAVARLLPRLVGPALATGSALAVDLPANKAEALFHVYEGGGVTATGPALLVRKSLADRVSLSAQYYVDAVSNASIDVVTTASPFDERRTAYDIGVDVVVRDSLLKFAAYRSNEPDYKVSGFGFDVSNETFGGMTTVSLGFSRASDDVGKKNEGFFDTTEHWQYRAGVTQVLSPSWLASANFEAVSDSGYLGSPYRVALVFGAAVPERNPRTRSSRAIKLASIYDLGSGQAVRADYRYFWDNWDIKAHTAEAGYSRHFGDLWIGDAFVRAYSQSAALFYSDNATVETQYISRNRQLSTYTNFGFGLKGSYAARRVPGQYEIKLHGAYEYVRFAFKDFTDLRTGSNYAYGAHVLQVYASATF